jgi:hypothetical protein
VADLSRSNFENGPKGRRVKLTSGSTLSWEPTRAKVLFKRSFFKGIKKIFYNVYGVFNNELLNADLSSHLTEILAC